MKLASGGFISIFSVVCTSIFQILMVCEHLAALRANAKIHERVRRDLRETALLLLQYD